MGKRVADQTGGMKSKVIDNADIAHIDQLTEMVEQERARALDGEQEPDVREGIEHTQWMFTYLAAQNENKPQLAITRAQKSRMSVEIAPLGLEAYG